MPWSEMKPGRGSVREKSTEVPPRGVSFGRMPESERRASVQLVWFRNETSEDR